MKFQVRPLAVTDKDLRINRLTWQNFMLTSQETIAATVIFLRKEAKLQDKVRLFFHLKNFKTKHLSLYSRQSAETYKLKFLEKFLKNLPKKDLESEV